MKFQDYLDKTRDIAKTEKEILDKLSMKETRLLLCMR